MPQFHCIHCGQHISAPDNLADTFANCPICSQGIAIPSNPGSSFIANNQKPVKKRGLGVAQKIILFIGMIAMVACCVYPPWIYRYAGTLTGVKSYWLITNPPKMSLPNSIEIDVTRLLVQGFIIFIVTAISVVLANKNKA